MINIATAMNVQVYFSMHRHVFEGMKAYTTEDGHIVTFRPDLNAARMVRFCSKT